MTGGLCSQDDFLGQHRPSHYWLWQFFLIIQFVTNKIIDLLVSYFTTTPETSSRKLQLNLKRDHCLIECKKDIR